MTKPVELEAAQTIVGLCDRFSCLPSEVLREDAEILRYLKIIDRGAPEPEPEPQ